VVLRRTGLNDIPAWASRHPYARVLACATNNDGHTKEGITFPSGPAQKALAQEVLPLAHQSSYSWCPLGQQTTSQLPHMVHHNAGNKLQSWVLHIGIGWKVSMHAHAGVRQGWC
jgi:hypothetical protein